MQVDKMFLDHLISLLQSAGVTELTFRDYTCQSSAGREDSISAHAFRHVPLREVAETIERLSCDQGSEDFGTLITSCVRTENGLRRLLLIDFKITVSPGNEHRLCRGLGEFAQQYPIYKQGVLFRTTKSYHFVGFTPLRYNSWVRMMGASLLLSPVIDSFHIGFLLNRGYGALPVSSIGANETPTIIPLL